ncbi:hypothetical protein M422DRAFT_274679 [Sphaerobolus stellatus SS14]|uniref:Uncharacterized protein n=1 Tax=Sphaerobolus stellatus (strain SS14) TaxID=990650 RepID=A0A0C9UGE8_SPHS4|nr:hypothetical protein M422DRAFT_274679 [Sphaerobolus stellatus SS14]
MSDSMDSISGTTPQQKLVKSSSLLDKFHQIGIAVQGLAQSQQIIFTALKFMTQRDLSTPNLPTIKFKDPPVFMGKTEDLEDFLMAIHNGIKMQRHAFTRRWNI